MLFYKEAGKLGDNWTFDSRLSYTYQKAQDFTDKLDEDTYGGQISYILGIVARLY